MRPDLLLLVVAVQKLTHLRSGQAQSLNPKLVVPTHYRTQAADADTCDIVAP